MKKYFDSLIIVGLTIILTRLLISSTSTAPEQYKSEFEKEYGVYALEMPNKIDFSGEIVPLEVDDIKERLDRELLVNTYWQSNTILLIKRANRWFPVIEPILKQNGIPDDFKYIAVIESGFLNLTSPSGAEGFWQFLDGTGKGYGLEINSSIDERYHVKKATQAACDYFKEAYSRFNNWTLVAASYNMGMGGVNRQLTKQHVSSYYDLLLSIETSRYVFRILALKEIFTHHDKYGFHFLASHLYQPYDTRIIRVDSTIDNLVEFAQANGSTYREIRIMNPWLQNNKLPNKSRKIYEIELPNKHSKRKKFFVHESLKVEKFIPEKKKKEEIEIPLVTKDSLIIHVVKKQENINSIAQKYGANIAEIQSWNNMYDDFVRKGQKIKIYLEKKGK
ncbi:MAG: transglycosylase SLT domain-containing protein [Bacteroidetes bacterium]|jgi:membrane-bound lytic murein transglycosylase D|nr:transglycosylase SLT domain-containing protein [Bacteroidota bacterium]MBT5529071.1 transglycosylase SLT domain-containing protein [Cytophagia bacterium]MBT3422806.1 transglycosylase SLT domain-containing protein [Bacteroidota bacterium]MBT3801358.1 transglycosylase SLT domain-containing protein [Bacteroidota bacterium]MBT3934774.1 transglycosylase SLT domain-containing protein [Bacteroidota bacterium]